MVTSSNPGVVAVVSHPDVVVDSSHPDVVVFQESSCGVEVYFGSSACVVGAAVVVVGT